jgi:hypothetical protein
MNFTRLERSVRESIGKRVFLAFLYLITLFLDYQVSGCLSYTDKITDGFYNILGMNPYLWVMCNDEEEGKRMPTLVALKAIEPGETSMEVVLVDRDGDSRLKMLHDKAQELYCSFGDTLVFVEQLGKLVAIHMGYVWYSSSK